MELETGKTLWQAPQSARLEDDPFLSHADGIREDGGFTSIAAAAAWPASQPKTGRCCGKRRRWKISIATVPSPLVLDGGKILLAGGYNAGSLLLQLRDQGGQLVPETVWKLAPEVFGATQHTPIFHDGQVFGTRPDGQFVCLGLDGKILWSSPAGDSFGLGPFLFADGLCFVMNDSGKLSLLEGSSARCNLLAQAQVLHGRESWGPMALAGGRLLARDFTRLVCLDVAAPSPSK